ncbi:hypothetical protein [Sinosporangium siamense]|uniref:Uncharacterized protein n=1 Tax=Sinosporangium siamense TaxID=1367973 RepID=A0A919RM21_9ACTN|nr:hypothetical protein [Sinosporangium siamense]GII96291.1 hypothetical protein Ssi02_65220 [Sinosporangium siamense]
MITHLLLPGIVLLGLIIARPTTASDTSGWQYRTAYGSVYVSADRKHITVCDHRADNLYAEAEYATSALGIHTLADTNGAEPGCGGERTFFSKIDVFKLCSGTRRVTRSCYESVWIKDQ